MTIHLLSIFRRRRTASVGRFVLYKLRSDGYGEDRIRFTNIIMTETLNNSRQRHADASAFEDNQVDEGSERPACSGHSFDCETLVVAHDTSLLALT